MYIKVVTCRVKPKHRRAKKVYQYVRVVERNGDHFSRNANEEVIATLGTLEHVRIYARTLIEGLERLLQD